MVRISNDLEQWITFFLNGIVETAQHGLKTFKAIIALRQEYDTIVKPTINYTLELARLGMQIAFGRVRRKTSPAGQGRSGLETPPTGY